MSGKGLNKKQIYSSKDFASVADGALEIVVDKAAQFVSRVTLNGPTAGNRMGHVMRAQLLQQLMINDQDPDVRCTIIRGAGESFCCGQDVMRSRGALPFFTNESDGQTSRNALEGWFAIMDLAKPVIAQVHGDCLGSGMELAAACDIMYVADDARIGYPEGRNMGLADMQIYPWICGMRNALSIMLLAETMDGETAVRRGFATRNCPASELEALTLEMAKRVAAIPADLLAYNKRSVHRAFEAQGMRANLRHGVDLEALMFHSTSGSILTRAAMQGGSRARAMPATPPPARQTAAKPVNAQASPSAARPAPAQQSAKPPKHTAAVAKPAATAMPTGAVKPTSTTQQAQQKPDPSVLEAAPVRSERISANPTTTESLEDPSIKLTSMLATAGVHLHLHDAVTVHIHQDENIDSRSRSKL